METTDEQVIASSVIDRAMTYRKYRNKIDVLLGEGKTTGSRQSEKMTEYTRMNVHRMNRLDQQTIINDRLKKRLKSVDGSWIWLVLTEGWCGDAAQNVPVIAKMDEAAPSIELRLILRDEHTDIMDQYLTNGGRSIPKLICLQANSLEEIGKWGPRPNTAQSMMMEIRERDDIDKKEAIKKIHKWYAENKTREIQYEFEQKVADWKKK